jgi:hypothetical protein
MGAINGVSMGHVLGFGLGQLVGDNDANTYGGPVLSAIRRPEI